jgi:outer membrane receptor protein involved in Fe transport
MVRTGLKTEAHPFRAVWCAAKTLRCGGSEIASAAALLLVLTSTPVSASPCAGCIAAVEQVPAAEERGLMTGVVRDVAGGIVPGASIVVRVSGREQQTVTGADGRFTASVPAAAEIAIVVRAPGFAEARRTIAPGDWRAGVEIVVAPAAVMESVTVTATRSERRTGDVPASVNLLVREDIKQSPAMVADDVLRQIPTFSLFRRTSSLASHPTAQGVSLRGIGPSGVSRTLVLLDGVPFNDPFGGWVYWSRMPLESADRIEVVDSSSSSLYGNYAMGGVIHFVTSRPAARTFELKSQYGSRNSPKVDFLGSHVWGKLGVAVDGNAFNTDGYPIVRASERGAVDNNAAVRFWNLNLKADYAPTDRVRAFFRAGYFNERRDNGKASTIDGAEEANDTTWRSASGGVRIRMPDQSDLQATIFTDVETFHSNFLAVPAATPPRSIGRMTLRQTVPTKGVGGMAQWSRAFGGAHYVTAGTDWRWVDGDSEERGLDAVTGTQVTLERVSGGTQRSVGVFVQDLIAPIPDLTVTLSARVDSWRNYDGHNLEHTVPSGTPTAGHDPALPTRSDTVASPRVAALYHVTDQIGVWGDVGWGFRAPTLNELYRQFRVGPTLTLANNALGPERLVGGEAGLTLTPASRVTIRTSWFDNRVKDPVSNVTISPPGAAVTQQRQNLGRTRIWGVQSDVEYRPGASWKLSGGYVYDQAKVTENPENRALVGNVLPQVPTHRGTMRVVYANPRYATVAASFQFVGAQFDEDQNLIARRLPKYAVMDLSAARAIGRTFEVFLGVQNLFDAEYFVGTLPTTVGAPRLVSAGFRLRLTGAGAARR